MTDPPAARTPGPTCTHAVTANAHSRRRAGAASSHIYALTWMPSAVAAIVNSSFSSSGSTPIADYGVRSSSGRVVLAEGRTSRYAQSWLQSTSLVRGRRMSDSHLLVRATGLRRAASGGRAGHPGRPTRFTKLAMTGAISVPVTAAPPLREAGPVSAVGRPRASAGPSACPSGALKRVMYHHSGCPRGDLNT